MTSHGLALCSRVLYDKQALDDKQRIEQLEARIKYLEVEKDEHDAKYKFLQLKDRLLYYCFDSLLVDSMWRSGPVFLVHSGKRYRGDNAFALLCKLCKVQYRYCEDLDWVSCSPYDFCHRVTNVDLVLCPTKGTVYLSFGKTFWSATNLEQQLNVYFLFYVLCQIDKYCSGYEYNETQYLWCLETFMFPYTHKDCLLPYIGLEAFEEFYMESERFSLETFMLK
jgi:hypothetical protein